jgi:hypothetical protein
MKVKFQADADLNENIVKGLKRRHPQIDFQTATQACLEGVVDEDVLSKAADEARVLVTHDRKTMPGHFGRFLEQRESPGVIVVSMRAEIARVIDDLLLVWEASEADEYTNTIRSIPF